MEMPKENKPCLLRIKYYVVNCDDLPPKKKKLRKKERMFLVRDINKLDEELDNLEEALMVESEDQNSVSPSSIMEWLRAFGKKSQNYFYSTLRT